LLSRPLIASAFMWSVISQKRQASAKVNSALRPSLNFSKALVSKRRWRNFSWSRAKRTGPWAATGTRDGACAEYVLVARLKAFSRWLWRRKYARHDPLDRLERPRVPKIHRQPYTEAEARRLLWAVRQGPAPELERALLLLGLDTGCRPGELCGLAISDVDLERGSVVFRRTKNAHPRRVIVRVDTLEDGGPCVAALRAWLAVRRPQEGVEALFVDRYGEALSPKQARTIWRQLGELAEVPNPIPARGRHTNATELLAEIPGGELHIRNRLGHLSKDVLADYVSISDPMAQQVANVASLSAKWQL